MHPITRREKLKKDLNDLIFCKESDFSQEKHGESLSIGLQSSYSRLCGEYRRLPTDRQGSGQVPLFI